MLQLQRKLDRTKSVIVAGVAALGLLAVGCPHRSPLWSPDGNHILLLARRGDEAVDKPAGAVWLVEARSRKAERLPDPAPGVQYLAAAWIDERSFAVLTAVAADGEVREGSEAIWRGTAGARGWTRVAGPQPSADRTPRRNPVVVTALREKALVYAAGTEAVVAVSLESGKELLRLEPAEPVGLGPGGGFLATRPDSETGGLELVAVGPELKPLWSKKLSALTSEISAATGKKTTEISITDASTSTLLGSPRGSEVGVTFVYTDVSWREGIAGYFVRLDGGDGKLLSARTAIGLPGRPGEAAGAAWAIIPAAGRDGDAIAIRSFPPGKEGKEAGGARLDLPGLKKAAVHGYSLSPDGKEFSAVIATDRVRLLIYPLDGQKIAGKPAEIEIKA